MRSLASTVAATLPLFTISQVEARGRYSYVHETITPPSEQLRQNLADMAKELTEGEAINCGVVIPADLTDQFLTLVGLHYYPNVVADLRAKAPFGSKDGHMVWRENSSMGIGCRAKQWGRRLQCVRESSPIVAKLNEIPRKKTIYRWVRRDLLAPIPDTASAPHDPNYQCPWEVIKLK